MMKKFLIIANNIGGLIRFRGMLIEKLMQDNEVVCAIPNEDEIDELRSICSRTVEIPIERRGLNPIHDIKLFRQYCKLIVKEKPNMVITYTIKPNVYGGFASRLAKVPYAINITGLGSAFENEGLLRKLVTAMNRVACKKAKVVFFENEENRQIFIKKRIVKEKQTHRLNGAGVDIDKFVVSDYPCSEKVSFLFIGRVMAEKGINELFEAMGRLIADGIDCELNVVGWYEENYRKEIECCEKAGWLHFHGPQKDVRPFINSCHCFVLPSWHEGMANTNLENAASGRPIITSNIYGCKEAVEENVSGYLVERKNAEALYRAMKKFTELTYEERKAMGLAGRRRMEEIFDKRKVVEETIEELLK